MWCGLLKVLALVMLTDAVRAAVVTVKPEDRIVQGRETIFMGTIVNATSNQLSWVVGVKRVVNATVTAHGNGTVTVSGSTVQTGGEYAVTYVPNGRDLNTNLTVKNPTSTMNNTYVELRLGNDKDGVQMIVNVECGQAPEGTRPLCSNVSCLANGTRNLASDALKYQRCIFEYRCAENGSWMFQTTTGCSPLICNATGKWGESCTKDCGAGCPGNPIKSCFANGSCADSSYMGVVSCAEGFTGSVCNESVTTTAGPTSESTKVTEGTTASTKVTEGTTASSKVTDGNTAGTGATDKPTGSTDEMTTAEATTSMWPLPECTSTRPTPPTPSYNCSKEGNTTILEAKCQANLFIKTCETTFVCKNMTWTKSETGACVNTCKELSSWGPNCEGVCSFGCLKENDTHRVCDDTTGRCMEPLTLALRTMGDCRTNYTGDNCETPICELDCNGGECLAPNYCGNCPKHFEHGKTCRNISLDGFTKGSLPSLAILAIIVILLTVASKWYIRSKLKEE